MGALTRATPDLATDYARWFVNRRAYTRQSDRPHPESGRHYYYRPRRKDGREIGLGHRDITRHLQGEITIGLYAINPQSQTSKWMAIDADYKSALEDLLKLQYELGQDGIQAALEQSRRGGHLWILFSEPILAKLARRYIRYLAGKLAVAVKGSGLTSGIEIFPKQDALDDGQFGNAIRGPLGIHRAAKRRYWFYGAAYDVESQMEYLRQIRRVGESQLVEIVRTLPEEPLEDKPIVRYHSFGRSGFHITEYVNLAACRKVGRNWVTQCPACRDAGRDRGKDNLAISAEEPQKYICWAGCTKEQIRAALGAPLPAMSSRERR